MAYKSFRWVGSGNTGATSINIFNWNHSGNWEVLKYTGSGVCGGWKYVPTTYCPGPFDKVLFGQPSLSTITTTTFSQLSKVKSPCLFGGFIGNASGGTWTNAGFGGSCGGVTYTSALEELVINNSTWGVGINVDGPSFGGGFQGSYNNTEYAFYNDAIGSIPFGGGLTPDISNLSNLNWIKQNYPNMGIIAGYCAGTFDYEFSVPGYTTNAGMDDITIKTYGFVRINQQGTSGSSPITLNCVGAYRPISGNMGATGYTGANAPRISTNIDGFSSRDVTIKNGFFDAISLEPSPRKVSENGALGLPTIKCTGNMSVLGFYLSCANESIVDRNVKFKDIVINNSITALDPQYGDGSYSIIDKTLASSAYRGVSILGSQYVSDVYATLYPGNTSTVSIDNGTIYFDPTSRPFADGYGIKRNFTETGISRMHELLPTLKRNSAIRCLTESGSASMATSDLTTFFPEDTTLLITQGIAPGTHILRIGGYDNVTGQTFTQNLEDININCLKTGLESASLMIQGEVNINKIKAQGGRIEFAGHRGIARIANLNMDEKTCLDMRNYLHENSDVYFGIVSSSGVCGGISNIVDSAGSQDSGGNIFLERGERLFNVSTTKGGRLVTLTGSDGVSTVSDSIPPSISTKSKS